MSTSLSKHLNLCSVPSDGYTNIRINLSMQVTQEKWADLLEIICNYFCTNFLQVIGMYMILPAITC